MGTKQLFQTTCWCGRIVKLRLAPEHPPSGPIAEGGSGKWAEFECPVCSKTGYVCERDWKLGMERRRLREEQGKQKLTGPSGRAERSRG